MDQYLLSVGRILEGLFGEKWFAAIWPEEIVDKRNSRQTEELPWQTGVHRVGRGRREKRGRWEKGRERGERGREKGRRGAKGDRKTGGRVGERGARR